MQKHDNSDQIRNALADARYSQNVQRSVAQAQSARHFQLFCVFMMAKPLIDITWNYGIDFGGLKVSLLGVSGVLVAIIGLGVAFRGQVKVNTVVGLFYLFICCYFLSLIIHDGHRSRWNGMYVVDECVRLFANVAMLLFALGFAARRSLADCVPILQSVWIGINVALFVNVVAMTFGWESYVFSDHLERNNGLYFDAGVLALISVQNFSLCIYMPTWQERYSRKIPKWLIYASMLGSIVLLGVSISRAGIVLAVISIGVYIFVFSRAAGSRQTAFGLLVAVGGVCYIFSENEFSRRFVAESDVLQQGVMKEITFDRGSVDLGDLNRIGSNRGVVIEEGLNRFFRGDAANKLLGDFTFKGTHCDYLDTMGRFGIVGIGVYLLLLSSALLALLKSSKIVRTRNAQAVVSLAISFLLMYIFYSFPFGPLWYTTPSWYVWIFVGLVLGQGKVLPNESRKNGLRRRDLQGVSR